MFKESPYFKGGLERLRILKGGETNFEKKLGGKSYYDFGKAKLLPGGGLRYVG
jgi:hypothetical protein